MAELDRFSLSNWSRAFTLSERAAGWRAAGRLSERPEDADRAARRLARWQAQNPFGQDGFFQRRLAQEGIGVDDLRALLGESPEAIAARVEARPEWLVQLERAWTTPPAVPFPLSPELLDGSPQAGFLEAVRPLLDAAYSDLTASLRELVERFPSPPFDPATAGGLLAVNLPLSLMILLNRTMALELHLAGHAGQLTGATPEERFQSFIDSLRDPAAAQGLLRQYPVLARQVVETVSRWVDYSLEILGHLAADADRLREAFSPGRGLGVLTEAQTGQGDAHRGRRSVALLRFDSGLGLVYKPRPLTMDAAFQDLLEWTGARGFAPAFRRLRVLDVDGHGWAERVEAAPCASAEEVARFYLRQGGYLALLYALSAIDMHHENLIAVGEHPVLVDLEALFHPVDETLGREDQGLAPDTVLRIGFLPTASWGAAPGEAGADLSGLAAVDGQILPRPMLKAEGVGTDQMRFSRQPMAIPVGEHRPTLQGAEVDLAAYGGEIVEGFWRMARLLASHRAELLSAAGPLAAFAAAPVRLLVRTTLAYSNLAFEGQHPYLLGDALDRDRHLDHLWSAVPETPDLERLIAAEHRDMERGDVPMFTTLPVSRDVWTSDGERIASFLKAAPFDRVHERLRRLDEAEIARQAWIVSNSLRAVSGRPNPQDRHVVRETEGAPARDELVNAAVEAGLRLDALAFRSGEAAFWFVQKFQAGPYPCVLGPAGPDLYLGISGIPLPGPPRRRHRRPPFHPPRPRRHRHPAGPDRLRRQAGGRGRRLRRLGSHRAHPDPSRRPLAGRVAARRGRAGGRPPGAADRRGRELRRRRRRRRLPRRPPRSPQPAAVRSGPGAGRALRRAPPRPRPPHGAGSRLGPRAGGAAPPGRLLPRRGGDLLGSPPTVRGGGRRPLSPSGPGGSGVRALPLPRQRRLARPAPRRADRAAFHVRLVPRGAGNRPRAPGQPALPGRCRDAGRHRHGGRATLAGGFGKGTPCVTAISATWRSSPWRRRPWAPPELAARVGRLTGGVLASIREHGWRCGLLGVGEVPGLMLGLAGIGYGLLRLGVPERVPSVLRLAMPAP